MSSKAIKRKAEEHLGYGLPKQQVFGLLMAEHPEAKPKRVAEIVRYRPTLHGRERYRGHHQFLLGIIALYGSLRVLRPLLEADFEWADTYRLVTLAPIATVMLGYSLYRWQGQVFEWVGWINVLGAVGMLNALVALGNGGGDAWNVGLSMLSVGIGALALFLAKSVFPKYKMEKDPLGQGLPQYVFPPEEQGMG